LNNSFLLANNALQKKVGKSATLNKGNNIVSVTLRGSQNETVKLDNIIIQPAIESALFQTDNHNFIEIERNFIDQKIVLKEFKNNKD
jgi:hypothetical protein